MYMYYFSRKFMCINDNIDHSKENAKTVSTGIYKCICLGHWSDLFISTLLKSATINKYYFS